MSNKVKLTMVSSKCKSLKAQKATLVGLGLKKIGSVSVLENTPSVQGMIRKVMHLLKVEQA